MSAEKLLKLFKLDIFKNFMELVILKMCMYIIINIHNF